MEQGQRKIRDAEFVNHWFHPFDGMQPSTAYFYTLVEAAMNARSLEGVRISRVAWKEGGLLTASREYLRIEWRRYIYDICAAPAGTGCYFSSWLFEAKAKLTACHMVGMLLSLPLFILSFAICFMGLPYIALLALLLHRLRQGRIKASHQTQELLLGLTILPPLLDLRRKPTYYEIDNASMFQSVAHSAFMQAIDAITDIKGIPRLSEAERKPKLLEFSKK